MANAFRQAIHAHTSSSDVELEQIDETLRIFGEAATTFSDLSRALSWLNLPSEVLDGQSPLTVIHSSEGRWWLASLEKSHRLHVRHRFARFGGGARSSRNGSARVGNPGD